MQEGVLRHRQNTQNIFLSCFFLPLQKNDSRLKNCNVKKRGRRTTRTFVPKKLKKVSTPGSNTDDNHRHEQPVDNRSASEDDYASDSDEEEQEDVADYCKGGYHVVNIGDLFQGRYHVIRKLGWGHFSTVWLAWDLTDKRYVALKIVKSASHYTETALDEMKLLRTVHTADPSDPGYPHVVQLLDHFKVRGIHGSHVCMVFEVLGHNLLKFIIKSSYRGISLLMAKNIIRQTLLGLNYLHTACKVIHTDIKPENILVCINEEEIQKLAVEATAASQQGKVSKALAATAPRHIVQKQSETTTKMSKNKKKKLKQKIKKQLQKHQQELEDDNGNNIDAKLTVDNENSVNKENGCVDDAGNMENVRDIKMEECNSQNDRVLPESEEKMDTLTVVKTIPENTANELSNTTREQPIAPAPAEESDCNRDVRMISIERNAAEAKELTNGCNQDRSRDEERKERTGVSDAENHTHNGMTVEEVLAERLKIDSGNQENMTRRATSFLDNPDIQVKIADLGNACWVDHHFTDEIQTRQYRSIEVLLGAGYGPPADMWSTACMAFELVTGDFLFEPHSGEDYSRDEDHIALIIELLGRVPRHVALGGKYSREFFTKKGELRHIKKLKPWSLKNVLMEKYEWADQDAQDFSDFLVPMMNFIPEKRATAAECLQHPWLNTS
ncbi:SRSF protein kinase 3-like isoform X2 [Hydractinia symbiolongicarpus]|uniref:SRSF protein kinase 3-like isoform X2 n=1 Tax=Hydractinia symbiolongicarpus TaxID=13093 RepID=UPI00254E1079|nr:SRSF protein kinase 3-like isoform X2 [Hydractinia symbiolongicarpus]